MNLLISPSLGNSENCNIFNYYKFIKYLCAIFEVCSLEDKTIRLKFNRVKVNKK